MSVVIEVPTAWKALAERIEAEGGLTLLLGTTDAGKTTLARWLLEALSAAGRRVAFLDGDVGQTTVGPPATVGLSLATALPTDTRLPPTALRFVGNVSPAGHMLTHVVAMARLAAKAHAWRAEIVLADTTGHVLGPSGSRLKFHKIELLQPRHLVALQREGELEPILRLFDGRTAMAISRLSVSPYAAPRSAEVRRHYRGQRFCEYFQASSPLEIPLDEVGLVGSWMQGGNPMAPADPEELSSELRTIEINSIRGLLLGLADEQNDLVGLGLLQDLDPATKRLVCLTPLGDRRAVRIVHFGSLRLLPSGEELGQATICPVTA